jgi:hypothetical protein
MKSLFQNDDHEERRHSALVYLHAFVLLKGVGKLSKHINT